MSNLGNREVFAKNLSYYSEKSGKTQKELAELVGVAPSTFSDWIKAKKYPRMDKIEILADYFKILKSDLIEDKTEFEQKNDLISDAIVRMRSDEEFLSLVEILNTLDKEKLSSVKQLILTFAK